VISKKQTAIFYSTKSKGKITEARFRYHAAFIPSDDDDVFNQAKQTTAAIFMKKA
jgi:hypothetical protein